MPRSVSFVENSCGHRQELLRIQLSAEKCAVSIVWTKKIRLSFNFYQKRSNLYVNVVVVVSSRHLLSNRQSVNNGNAAIAVSLNRGGRTVLVLSVTHGDIDNTCSLVNNTTLPANCEESICSEAATRLPIVVR